MITITRRLRFEAGHRVFGHESQCKNMHGHSYVAFITASAPALDKVGRVIDFSVLKARIGTWLDDKWDHAFIYWEQDIPVRNALFALAGEQGQRSKFYALPSNPTAENMARYLLEIICPALLEGTGVTVTAVTIQETENCTATAELS